MGTNVRIRGSELLGFGFRVAISRVSLGDSDADIVGRPSDTLIEVRAQSGIPSTGTVRVNTTDTYEGVMFDGPYYYLEDGWTQLEDGNITDIIPPAAQSGRSVLLCGNDLLGNGMNISTIQHGSNVFSQLQASPSPSLLSQPGSECLEVQVPSNITNVDDSPIVITSDTGAMVTSTVNFSVSAIDSVTPSRGQVDTIVTIRGRGLLSGYPASRPNVFLSDTFSTLMRSSDSEIVVRAGPPPPLNQGVSNSSNEGSILIEVSNSGLTFNVSSDMGWQYEEPGAIDTVYPDFGQLGTLITINGTNLLAYGSNLTHATVGGMNATIWSGASNSRVQLIVPDANVTSFVDIELFSDTGASIRGSRIFEYRERGSVSAASPSLGQDGTFGEISIHALRPTCHIATTHIHSQ
jgi:hypothetical protein